MEVDDGTLDERLAVLWPSLLRARIQRADEKPRRLSIAACRELLALEAPVLLAGDKLKGELGRTLRKVCLSKPSAVLAVPYRSGQLTRIGLLSVPAELQSTDRIRLSALLTYKLMHATQASAGELQGLNTWLEHSSPTVAVHLPSGAIAVNALARELLGRGAGVVIEDVVGRGGAEVIQARSRELRSFGRLDIEFANPLQEAGKPRRLRALASLDEDVLALVLGSADEEEIKGEDAGSLALLSSSRFRGSAPEQSRKQDILFWVCSDQIPPFAVRKQTEVELTIGRLEGNDIMLKHTEVSRTHARLMVRDRHVLLEDLGSANGVLINGTRQDQKVLRPGDWLRIGPYNLFIRSPQDPAMKSYRTGRFRRQRPHTVPLSGSLSKVKIAEVSAEIHSQKLDGVLSIVHGENNGRIVFRDGRPHGANVGRLNGNAAFDFLAKLGSGVYTFARELVDFNPSESLHAGPRVSQEILDLFKDDD